MDSEKDAHTSSDSPENSNAEHSPQSVHDGQGAKDAQQAPADALSKTPEELEEERTEQAANDTDLDSLDAQSEKKLSSFQKVFRKINVYFLLFLLLLVVAGVIAAINYFSSIKQPTEATINSQALNQETLKQLANTDTSVGSSSQTLTIQGNAIIAGQTLARGNLNVAGNFQTGGTIQGPSITISGSANLPSTQISSLQVATTVAIQGDTSLNGNLTVSGSTSLNGSVTAAQITVTRLVLSGNAVLEVPNHIRFSGGTPNRSADNNVLGNGGSASVSGSDTAGSINVNSGNNPKSGCFVRVSFQQAFSGQPHVIVSPVGDAAGRMQYYVERDTAGFRICSANTITANKSFGFDYLVTY